MNSVFRINKCFQLNINYPNSAHIYRVYLDIFRSTSAFAALLFSVRFSDGTIHLKFIAPIGYMLCLQNISLGKGSPWGSKSSPRKCHGDFFVIEIAQSNHKYTERELSYCP